MPTRNSENVHDQKHGLLVELLLVVHVVRAVGYPELEDLVAALHEELEEELHSVLEVLRVDGLQPASDTRHLLVVLSCCENSESSCHVSPDQSEPRPGPFLARAGASPATGGGFGHAGKRGRVHQGLQPGQAFRVGALCGLFPMGRWDVVKAQCLAAGVATAWATAAMITAEERVAEGKAEVMAEVATPTGGGRWRARRRCRWRGRRWRRQDDGVSVGGSGKDVRRSRGSGSGGDGLSTVLCAPMADSQPRRNLPI